MKQLNFKMLDKKLEKKNAELQEVRELKKKLDDKEKEICASIDKLQNQKIEIIFEQVKKGIKNEKLDITSESILPMLEILRNNQQIMNDKEMIEDNTESLTVKNAIESKSETNKEEETIIEEKTENDFVSRLNSVSDIV